MIVFRHVLRCTLMIVLTVSVFHNARSTATVAGDVDAADYDESRAAPPKTHTTQQQTDRPASAGGGGGRGGTAAEDRLERTKGRALAAARRAVDETVHKLASTVDGIRRTVAGDDGDDAGGDRRVSDALDGLLRAVGAEGRAAFEYASDVINETADRAKAAVERAQRQKRPQPDARSAAAAI